MMASGEAIMRTANVLLWLIAAVVYTGFSQYLPSKPESLQNVLNACMYVYSM